MFLGKAICPLGFSRRGDFIGEGASLGGGPGGLTMSGCDILAQGLIGLIGYSYQQGIPSFLEAHLKRTPG
jgi:hypothetical protein